MKDVGRNVVRIARLVGLSLLIASAAVARDRPLTVVSWGGSYARACVKGYHERFTADTGIAINLEDFNGGLAQVRAQVDVGNVYWTWWTWRLPTWCAAATRACWSPFRWDHYSPGQTERPLRKTSSPVR